LDKVKNRNRTSLLEVLADALRFQDVEAVGLSKLSDFRNEGLLFYLIIILEDKAHEFFHLLVFLDKYFTRAMLSGSSLWL